VFGDAVMIDFTAKQQRREQEILGSLRGQVKKVTVSSITQTFLAFASNFRLTVL
jgi:hypothetical protein